MTPDELIAFRRKWGLSQAGLALEIRLTVFARPNIAQSTIHGWERRKRPPDWVAIWVREWEAKQGEPF